MDQSSRSQLEAFVDKAHRVERSAYLKKLLAQGGTKLTINWSRQDGLIMTSNFPGEEEVDALVLTARLFAQDNDRVSFGSLAKLMEKEPTLSAEWKDRFTDTRDSLNEFLQSKSIVRNPDGTGPTQWEIFETFVYGGLAHTGKAKEETYKAWKSNGAQFAMYESEFHRTLTHLLDAVYQVRLISELELKGEPIPPFED